MKKKFILISILLVAVSSVFASCSTNRIDDTETDGNSSYYETVSNSNTTESSENNTEKASLSDKDKPSYKNDENKADNIISFDSDGKSEQAKPTLADDIKNTQKTTEKNTATQNDDSNSVPASQAAESTENAANPPATDKDGWVTKWY